MKEISLYFPSLVHQNYKEVMNNVKINQFQNKSNISLKWYQTKSGFYVLWYTHTHIYKIM